MRSYLEGHSMSEAITAIRKRTITAVVIALRKSFGDRAPAVVERQIQAATADALETWTAILIRLRSDQDHQQ